MRNLSTIISKETCLFYGLPGTAILAVSLILSCKVSNDFAGSTFVNTISFFGCNALLWLLYLDFIKSLFPNELKDVESKSLERSLTSSPEDGHIKLDRPKHTDNYAFHF